MGLSSDQAGSDWRKTIIYIAHRRHNKSINTGVGTRSTNS